MALNTTGYTEFAYVSVHDEIDWIAMEKEHNITKDSYESNASDDDVGKLIPLAGCKLTTFQLAIPDDPKVIAEAQAQGSPALAAAYISERYIKDCDGLLRGGRPVKLKRRADGALDDASRKAIPMQSFFEIGTVLLRRASRLDDPLFF